MELQSGSEGRVSEDPLISEDPLFVERTDLLLGNDHHVLCGRASASESASVDILKASSLKAGLIARRAAQERIAKERIGEVFRCASNYLMTAPKQQPTGVASPRVANLNANEHSLVVAYLASIYRGVQTGFLRDHGFSRNDNVARASLQVDSSNLQYGEVTYAGMGALYNALKLRKSDVFFDLGSGTGKLTLYVALRNEVERSVGLELGEKRHKSAIFAGTAVLKDFEGSPKMMPAPFVKDTTSLGGLQATIQKTMPQTVVEDSSPKKDVSPKAEMLTSMTARAKARESRQTMLGVMGNKQALSEGIEPTQDGTIQRSSNGGRGVHGELATADSASSIFSPDSGYTECRSFYSHDAHSGSNQQQWCAPFEFHRKDISQERYEPSKVSVVYLSNVLMDLSVESRTIEALLKAPTFRRLISGTPVNHPRLKKVGTVKYSATWAKLTSASIYEVIGRN